MCVKELNLNSGSGAGCVRVCVMTQGRKSVFQPRCLKRCSEDSAAFVSLAFLCEWLQSSKRLLHRPTSEIAVPLGGSNQQPLWMMTDCLSWLAWQESVGQLWKYLRGRRNARFAVWTRGVSWEDLNPVVPSSGQTWKQGTKWAKSRALRCGKLFAQRAEGFLGGLLYTLCWHRHWR